MLVDGQDLFLPISFLGQSMHKDGVSQVTLEEELINLDMTL